MTEHEPSTTEVGTASTEPSSSTQPLLPLKQSDPPDWDGRSALSEVDIREVLTRFRDTVIQSAVTGWDPSRSILRDSMIEMFIAQRFDDPEDWSKKVPMYLRQSTAPSERHFLDQIAAIVGRIRK